MKFKPQTAIETELQTLTLWGQPFLAPFMLYISFNYSSLDRFRQAILVSYMVNVGLVILTIVFLTTLSAASGQNQGRIGSLIAYLSGDQEVPESINSFVGRFGIRFADDLSWAEIDLTVFAPNVIGAHFHCGAPGANGPIVVNLRPGGLFGAATDAAGTISKPVITNDDVIPKTPMECSQMAPLNNIASLYNAILRGNIYVNVHTTAFPGGALRTQLFGKNLQ